MSLRPIRGSRGRGGARRSKMWQRPQAGKLKNLVGFKV